MATRLVGEFVIVVVDVAQRCVLVIRDVAGTRPVYFAPVAGGLLLASRIVGVRAALDEAPALNVERLLDYLVVEFDRDDERGSFYQGIERLPAGHLLRFDDTGLHCRRYWFPSRLTPAIFATREDCRDALMAELDHALACRVAGGGRVAAMLSGGLDSSALVARLRSQPPPGLNPPLATYTLVQADRAQCPDWRSARAIVAGGGLDSRFIDSALSAGECESLIEDLLAQDEPFALAHGLTDALVYRRAAADGVQTVLDGMAGDLLFLSPSRSLSAVLAARTWGLVPGVLAAFPRHGLGSGRRLLAWQLLRLLTPERLRLAWRDWRDRQRPAQADAGALSGDLLAFLPPAEAHAFLARRRRQRMDAGRLTLTGDAVHDHGRLLESGVLSFAHEVNGQIARCLGIEARSPFSDRRLLEFAVRMPLTAKIADGWYKRLLREALADVLPAEVVWRKEIGGHPGWRFFERLIRHYREARPAAWNAAGLSAKLSVWIDPAALQAASGQFQRTGDYTTGFNLLMLAILAEWLERHFPAELSGGR